MRGGWGLDALGKFFRRRRRRRRRRPPGVGGGSREFGYSRYLITKMRRRAHFCDLISEIVGGAENSAFFRKSNHKNAPPGTFL